MWQPLLPDLDDGQSYASCKVSWSQLQISMFVYRRKSYFEKADTSSKGGFSSLPHSVCRIGEVTVMEWNMYGVVYPKQTTRNTWWGLLVWWSFLWLVICPDVRGCWVASTSCSQSSPSYGRSSVFVVSRTNKSSWIVNCPKLSRFVSWSSMRKIT